MQEPLVIIGNGMASARFVQELTVRAPGRFAVTVVGEEAGLAYNRIMLSPLLADTVQAASLALQPQDWWDKSGVRLIAGVRATAVDRGTGAVRLENGESLSYSKLVFATGSQALRLPIPGADLPGVHVFRTLSDTEQLIALAETKARVAVIGGGLLGIEAAYGLAKRGARVTLIHLMDRLMERQIDMEAAAMVKAALASHGIEVALEAQSSHVLGADKVEALALNDGRIVEASAVVMAAGIRPNSALAKDAGLAVNRGIVVDEQLQASANGIFAIGECAEFAGQCCGLVEPAYEQAAILARHLCGECVNYMPQASATNLKVSGLPVFSAGDFLGGEGTSQILLRDPSAGVYKKFVLREGRLAGAVLVGDTGDAAWYRTLIREQTPVDPFRSSLAFGEAYCATPVDLAA